MNVIKSELLLLPEIRSPEGPPPSTPLAVSPRGIECLLLSLIIPQPWARVLTQAVGCLPGPMVLRAEPAEACISPTKPRSPAGSAGKWMCGIVNTSQSLAGENEPRTENRDSKLLPVVLCSEKACCFLLRRLGLSPVSLVYPLLPLSGWVNLKNSQMLGDDSNLGRGLPAHRSHLKKKKKKKKRLYLFGCARP